MKSRMTSRWMSALRRAKSPKLVWIDPWMTCGYSTCIWKNGRRLIPASKSNPLSTTRSWGRLLNPGWPTQPIWSVIILSSSEDSIVTLISIRIQIWIFCLLLDVRITFCKNLTPSKWCAKTSFPSVNSKINRKLRQPKSMLGRPYQFRMTKSRIRLNLWERTRWASRFLTAPKCRMRNRTKFWFLPKLVQIL